MRVVEAPERILTLTGHWPNRSPSIFKRMLQILEALFIFSLAAELPNQLNHYQGFSEQLSVAVSATSYLIKLYIFKFKLGDFQELINSLELKEFNDYPKHLSSTIEQTVKFSQLSGITFLSICFFTCSVNSLGPVFLPKEYPFLFSYNVGAFKPAVYAFQVIGMFSVTMNNASLDVLAITLMGFGAGQIKILNRKIIELSDWNENEGGILHSVNADLCKCAKHHVEIIRFHELLENVFSMILFAQYGTSAIGICNVGFQLVHVQPRSFQFLTMVFYFSVMMAQLALYCWFGNEIIVESLGIKDACYEFKWFEADIKTRKTLNIMMERSKIPLILTAGKLSDLSLESYASVMNTSYSYFTLMQTLFGEK